MARKKSHNQLYVDPVANIVGLQNAVGVKAYLMTLTSGGESHQIFALAKHTTQKDGTPRYEGFHFDTPEEMKRLAEHMLELYDEQAEAWHLRKAVMDDPHR